MNETFDAVEASSQIDPALGLVVVVGAVVLVAYGWWIGRLFALPSGQSRTILRKALDRHLSALEAEVGKDSEDYRLAAQLRHGRVLREKYD